MLRYSFLLLIAAQIFFALPANPYAKNYDQVKSVEDLQLYPSEETRQKVKSYSHGNYLYFFISTLYTFLVLYLFLWTGFSARLREFIFRIANNRYLSVALFWVFFLLGFSLLTFPLRFYRGYIREHAYGFSNLSLSGWVLDYGKSFLVTLLAGAVFFAGIYWIFYKSPRRWWLWSALLTVFFVIFTVAVQPELIEPLFFKHEPVKDPLVRSEVLKLAGEHGIQPEEIYQVNFSRRSKKMNAWVTGVLGTERIVITDTLLEKGSLEEVLIVVGHEIGHYKLHHIWNGIAVASVSIFLFAYLFQKLFGKIVRRYSQRLGFEDIRDPASLPMILLLFGMLYFVLMPLFQTYSRYQESQADWYALNATGLWKAEISIDRKFGQFGEMDPHPAIEFMLYSHPSLKRRIQMALDYRDLTRQKQSKTEE